jgi:transposase
MFYVMKTVTFKALTSSQVILFPENLGDRIPSNHPVRLVSTVVDELDLSSIISNYKGGGTSSFHPRMMVKVLFYSYLSNVYSCRKIEKALQENIYFMWLSGNSTPDFRTINYFRGKRLKKHIHQLFSEVVKLLQDLDFVSLDMQYIDGTKIESASNRYAFVWRKSTEKHKAKLEEKIKAVLQEIDAQIKTDDKEAKQELPQNIDTALLKEKLSELNTKLKQSPKAVAKQIEALQNEHLPRLEKYEKQLEILDGRNSYSKTDKDATFMRLKDDHMQNGQLKPAYNAQISTEEQFITHYSIHQTAGDTTTLESHLNGFEQAYNKQSKDVIADAGYGSEENYELMKAKKIDAYVKYNHFHIEQKRAIKNNPFLPQNLFYNQEKDFYVCPMGQRMEKIKEAKRISSNGYEANVSKYQAARCQGCPLRGMCHQAKENRTIEINYRLLDLKKQARELLNSELGLAHRSKRPIEVEAVFGQLKSNNKFTRFTLRGLENVNLEFGLMAMAHNLRKMTKIMQNAGDNTLINYILVLITRFFKRIYFFRPKNETINHFNPALKFAA